MNRHLNDEQFGELLAGATADREAMGHLEWCAACREELSSMRAAVGDLRTLSVAWSEQRAARVQVPSRWTVRWHTMPGWGAAVAAVLFCGVAIGVHEERAAQMQAPASMSQTEISQNDTKPTPTAEELAQDNRLMRSIDDELSQQVRPQVPASELAASSRSARRHISSEEAN